MWMNAMEQDTDVVQRRLYQWLCDGIWKVRSKYVPGLSDQLKTRSYSYVLKRPLNVTASNRADEYYHKQKEVDLHMLSQK